MAEFRINRIRFTWKGDWVTGTPYIKDDIIRYRGKSYVCLVGHTASPDFNTDLEYVNTLTEPDTAVPKWGLWFDGYEWRNNWQTNTLYNLGDYVKYGSIVYICNDSHVSASTYAQGLELDLSKWTRYAFTDNWDHDWTVSTRYKLNDIVRYRGTIYRCNYGHTSAATITLGLEHNLAYWDPLTYGNDWRTDWTPATRYTIGDVIRYGGIVYKCIEGHTSAATTLDGLEPDILKWTLVNVSIDYVGLWSFPTRYKLNDIVKYGADLYICNQSHVSTSVFSTGDFTVWIPGLEFATSWDINTSYIKGDIVVYGGYEYTSNISNNLGNIPSTSVVEWTLLVKNYNIKNEWDSGINYRTGDLVRRHGYLYVAIADSNNIETTETGSWTLVNPGMQWRGPWVSNVEYVIGDVVTFDSTAYICVVKHNSLTTPLADASNIQWQIYVRGEQFETLQKYADIQTYSGGSHVSVAVGAHNSLLKVSGIDSPIPAWGQWGVLGGVYYVSTTGQDLPSYGRTVETAWRTIKYACSQVSGPATIFIKTGTYNESIPIVVPAGVALVGDELRGTVVQPARSINCIATASSSTTDRITVNTTEGIQGNDQIQIIQNTLITTATTTSATGNKITLGFTFGMTVNMPIVFTGLSFGNLVSGTVYYVKSYDSATSTITISTSYNGATMTQANASGIMTATAGGFAGLNTGQKYYVIGSSITSTTFQVSTAPNGPPVQLTDTSGYSSNVYGADAINDMFHVRNASGIRNMSLTGLLGGLGAPNEYNTKRPTGGAYVSLDPGTGPNDSSVWITTRSPYIQNVTNIGQGCTGLKVDGTLHNGGNRSIVANDFTQLISDSIGAWVTGPNSLAELVSVFAYYGHCGYLAENGGKIRATNGNTSYGTYGCVAEGYDITETPFTGTVDNRNQHAQIAQAFIGEATNKILKLEYSNAGQNYTGVTYTFAGAGSGVIAVGDEFRDNGVFEVRITGTDYAAGGSGYITASNQAQAGNTQTITIASNDQNTFANYYLMRLILTSGTGVGQYGYIAYYDSVSKVATIAKESITAQVSTATNSTNNLISVPDTTDFAPGTAIVIKPNLQTTSAFQTQHTICNIASGYITNGILTIVSVTSGAPAIGMILTGGAIPSGVYITANVSGSGNNSTWTVSQNVTVGSQVAPIAITAVNDLITLTSTTDMYIGEAIVFTGSVFGSVVGSSTYYITYIVGNSVAVSTSFGGTNLTVTNAIGSMSVTAGGMLGGLTAGQIYYVIAANFTANSFAVSTSLGGLAVSVTTQNTGSFMTIHAVGWEHINPGTTIANPLDSTSVYSIEPCVKFSAPSYSSTTFPLPSTSNWISNTYGNGKFVAITASGASAYSTNGQLWVAGNTLPGSVGTWKDVTYGGGYYVAVASGTTTAAYSTDGINWISTTSNSSAGYTSVSYGNGVFATVCNGSYTSATFVPSTNTWTAQTVPILLSCGIVYGSIGAWVIASGSVACYSTDNGNSWNSVTMPSGTWTSITWGNGRFVAIASGSATSAYSFDGITWVSSTLPAAASWTSVNYGQGLFFAVASGTTLAATSQDGLVWKSRSLSASSAWSSIVFGNPTVSSTKTPCWSVISTTSSNTSSYVVTGATAIGRASVASNKISVIKIWEPGSGYISTPIVTIIDPNATSLVTTVCRYATGVIGNPTFVNRGSGYRTSTTVVSVYTGDGFADIYQPSKYLSVKGLPSMPTPGAALTISGNTNQYRIVNITDLGGGKAYFQIAPPLTIALAPEDNTGISIRQKYSQCRITGHDFLLIGTGNKVQSNYPNTDVTTAVSYQQILESNGGRVFQTSTDQDGNFKVGNLFGVQQASGIVTISADQLSLTGLQSLALGGFSLGTNSVVITQFSTDSYFTANSDSIVPTQKAIKAYLARNIAGGGSNAQAGAIVAGTFGVGGPNRIYSTVQQQLYVRNSMRLTKGANGTMIAKTFFAHGFATSSGSSR